MAKRRKKIFSKKRIREIKNKYSRFLITLEVILAVIGMNENGMLGFMQSTAFRIVYNLLFMALIGFDMIIYEIKPTTGILAYLGIFFLNLWLKIFPSLDRLSLLLNIILTFAPIVYFVVLFVRKPPSDGKSSSPMVALIWGISLIQLVVKSVNLIKSYHTTPFLIPALCFAIAAALGTVIFHIVKKKIRFSTVVVWPLITGILVGVLFLLTLCSVNYSLDLSKPEVYSGVIVDSEIDFGGRRGKTTYEITVLSGDEEIDFGITRAQYYDYYIGQDLTFYLYDGAFGVPYYIIE